MAKKVPIEPIEDPDDIEQVIGFLNELLAFDRNACSCLVTNRVPVVPLGDTKFRRAEVRGRLGLLGVVNGMLNALGKRRQIEAVFDAKNENLVTVFRSVSNPFAGSDAASTVETQPSDD
mgnify:CR=1 FL=1